VVLRQGWEERVVVRIWEVRRVVREVVRFCCLVSN
jgi:hypothetical protein